MLELAAGTTDVGTRVIADSLVNTIACRRTARATGDTGRRADKAATTAWVRGRVFAAQRFGSVADEVTVAATGSAKRTDQRGAASAEVSIIGVRTHGAIVAITNPVATRAARLTWLLAFDEWPTTTARVHRATPDTDGRSFGATHHASTASAVGAQRLGELTATTAGVTTHFVGTHHAILAIALIRTTIAASIAGFVRQRL